MKEVFKKKRKTPPNCNPEVFKNGQSIFTGSGPSQEVEAWVVKVREASGQRVDWHYSGGVVNVLFLGDREKVAAAIEAFYDEFPGQVLGGVPQGALGPFRSGVHDAPEGAVAVSTVGGNTFYTNQR